MAEQRDTSVDLSGLLTVLGEHLYSTPKVALRELVQNAHDSITRRRIESPDAFVSRIDVTADAEAGAIVIADNGAGLTENEIHRFLATIGAGYTRLLREQGDEFLIGQFGLGFLSAFVVADEVTVATTSYQSPDVRWAYVSRGGMTYEVQQVPPAPVGTTVTLTVKQKFRTMLDGEQLSETLRRYCSLLRHPIHLAGSATAVNDTPPPWRRQFADTATRAQAELDFADAFDPWFSPLCTIPVHASGNSDVAGLLWVQDGASYATSDNRAMSVFVRGMLLDDKASELLPRWAGFVGGVVESAELVPTASREDLQRTSSYDAAQAVISEALIVGLSELARTRPEVWRRIMRRHSEAMLGAALVDDRLFDVIAPLVQIPTSAGDLSPAALVRAGKVYVSYELVAGFEEMIFKAVNTPIARGTRYGVVPFLRRWCHANDLALVEVGTAGADEEMFRSTEVDDAATQWLQRVLADDGEEVVMSRFAPPVVPMVKVIDRDAELRDRLDDDEADSRISSMALALARLYTDRFKGQPSARLYVNLDNSAVAAVVAAKLMDNPRADEGAMVLRALKHVVSGGDQLVPSLEVLSAVVERIVEGD